MPQERPANLKSRYVGVGKDVHTALGIPREDKAARIRYTLDMFGLFGAPCLIVVCVPAALPRAYAALDVGLFCRPSAWPPRRRLATCALAASVNYPQLIRRLAPVPEDAPSSSVRPWGIRTPTSRSTGSHAPRRARRIHGLGRLNGARILAQDIGDASLSYLLYEGEVRRS